MIETFHKETFKALLNSTFAIHTQAAGVVEVQLVEVTGKKTADIENFSLVFRGPLSPVFRHDTHQVKHPQLGEFDLFLGPIIHKKTDGVYYQAIFNRVIK